MVKIIRCTHIFEFFIFLPKKWPKIAENGNFSPFLAIFSDFRPFLGQKIKNFKMWVQRIIFTILYYNLAKFGVSSTFLPWLLFKNVILRYRAFKFSGPPFFTKFQVPAPISGQKMKFFQFFLKPLWRTINYTKLTNMVVRITIQLSKSE